MKTRHYGQTGDTIVEVLIAIAIVALVLAGAYKIATHSLNDVRQSQEHSEALKYAQSQLELLQSAASNPATTIFAQTYYFCMTSSGPQIANTPAPGVAMASPVPTSNYIAACQQTNGITYNEAISASSPALNQYVFTITVVWPSIQGNGNDQISMSYKLDK